MVTNTGGVGLKTLRIFSPEFTFLGEIENYESFFFTRRSRKVGEFELHINVHSNFIDTLQNGNLVYLAHNKVGIIRYRELSRENLETLIVKGPCVKSLLSSRITVPSEGNSNDSIQGTIEQVAHHYVIQNAISPIDTKRVIPHLDYKLTNHGGETISWNSRYKALDEELEKITQDTSFWWDVEVDLTSKKYVFVVNKSNSKTSSQAVLPPVIFSIDFDNIAKSKFIDSSLSHRNIAYVGGQGEGAERTIIEVGENSGFERFEMFVDARDIEAADDLPKRGYEKLQELSILKTFESEVAPFGSFIYGEDWDLGDVVTVTDKQWGITLDTPIPEIREVYEPNNIKVEPVFGNTIPTLKEKIKQLVDVPKSESKSIPTKTSQLENDAQYVTSGELDNVTQRKTYTHNQIAPSEMWTITHNMDKFPSIFIVDSAGTTVVGDITYDSMNSVTITFSFPFSGQAYLN